MGKGLKWTFSKEGIRMAKKHMKRCPTSLLIGKMPLKPDYSYKIPLSTEEIQRFREQTE